MKNALGACVRFGFAALLLLVARSSLAQIPDPGVPGPRDVTRAEYDFGDRVFEFSGCPTPGTCPVEMRADVHYPTDLSESPFPIVVFLHGWHLSCYNPTTLQFFLQ